MVDGFRPLCAAILVAVSLSPTVAFSQQDTIIESDAEMSERASAFRRVIAILETDAAAGEAELKEINTALDQSKRDLERTQADLAKARDALASIKEELVTKIAEALDLTEANGEATRQTADLTTQIESAKATLIAVEQNTVALTVESLSLEAKIEELQNEMPFLSADVEALRSEKEALSGDVTRLEASLDEIKTQSEETLGQLDATQNKLGEAAAESELQIASFRQAQLDAEAELSAVQTRLADAGIEIAAQDQVLEDRKVLSANIEEEQATLAEIRSQINIAEQDLSALRKELSDAQKPEEVAPAQEIPAPSSQTIQMSPRAANTVRNAIRNAPGLNSATPQQRGELERLLIEGTCSYDALGSIFDTINRQTLVSLIRDLGRC